MLELRKEDSPLKPYFDILPRDYSNHPLMWDTTLLDLSRGTGVDVLMLEKRESLAALHKHFLATLVQHFPGHFPSFTFEDFCWVHLILQTRCWLLQVDGEWDLVLVPFVDMLNHQPGGSPGYLNEASDFVIRASEESLPGEQVYYSYGAKSNLELLTVYGFVIEDNPDDYHEISVSLNQASGAYVSSSASFKLADNLSRGPLSGKFKILPNALPDAFLKTLRRAYLSLEELEDPDSIAQLERGHAISFQNERMAVHTALMILSQAYEEIGSTLAFDLMKLRDKTLSENERNIYLLRKSQKSILRNARRTIRQSWEQQLLAEELLGGLQF